MKRRELRDTGPTVTSTLGESRSRILAMLQEANGPLGVIDISAPVRLHPNTVRFHLDALAESGLVERTTEERTQPGRPRTLYTANPDSTPPGRRSYQFLAKILTSYVATQTSQPKAAARELGVTWGRELVDRTAIDENVDAALATHELMESLIGLGFDPEAVTTGAEQKVLLHHCPFREAAQENREVVCSIHLGLMQGLLSEINAPIQAQRLEPFVEPSLCVTHLAPMKPLAPRKAS